MIFEQTVRLVCAPDPLDVAKERVQTRAIAKVIRERRDRVHSALARSIPTEGQSSISSGQVQA